MDCRFPTKVPLCLQLSQVSAPSKITIRAASRPVELYFLCYFKILCIFAASRLVAHTEWQYMAHFSKCTWQIRPSWAHFVQKRHSEAKNMVIPDRDFTDCL